MESKEMATGVLVIDDDPDDLELFREALTRVRPDVRQHVSDNGVEAVRYLQAPENPLPDLVFLDINMPVMNGWDCLAVLKMDDQLKDIPVIIYTTSSTAIDRQKAAEAGALCFISKLMDFTSLKQMLDIILRHLEQRQTHLICHEITKFLKGLPPTV